MVTRIYLDVDGVLNAFAVSVHDDGEWSRGTAGGFPMTWDAQVVERLDDLVRSGDVEVVWLTTWGSRAASEVSMVMDFESGKRSRSLRSREEFWADVRGQVDVPEYGLVWPSDWGWSGDSDLWWKAIELIWDLEENPPEEGAEMWWIDDDLVSFGRSAGGIRGVLEDVQRVAPVPEKGLTLEMLAEI